MYQDRVVLCGASSYEKKYYLNEDFKALPQQIQDELKIMCPDSSFVIILACHGRLSGK